MDFCVLVLDGALPSSVAVTRDMLATATALSSRLGVRAPSWALYSIDGGDVRLGAELKVASKRLPVRSRRDRSLWIIPGLGVADPGAVMARLERADARAAAKRIGAHLRRGGRVAASCASVFLLNAAGVLAGRRATTSWWLAPALTRSASGCLINADQIVCDDGAVITAGAAFAHCDLMLHVLRQFGGDRLADAVSRVLLIESRHAQAPFVIPELLVNGSELVARLAARIEASLPEALSVAGLAREFCVSERTLARHVQRATGRSTRSLIQSVRLRRARALLENSRMTVEQVAAAVGYQDTTALRRLMKQSTGVPPSRFRSAARPGRQQA